MTKVLYKDEAYAVVGATMEVYNQLGFGFLEAVYQEALAIEMGFRQIPFQEQVSLQMHDKNRLLQQHYIPDFIAYDKIIIEIKAIKQIGPNEEAQTLNYLKATGLRLGLLINFGSPKQIERKRFVL